MKAAVYLGRGSVELRDWPRPTVGPGELLLRMRGCGLCGSDIGKILTGTVAPPAVFGHEVVGEVAETGRGVEEFGEGDRLVVAHHVPCFTCHYCRRGSPSMCRAFKTASLDPGGFAEYVRVPAPHVRHAAFRMPKEVSDETASFTEPLACCLRATKRARVDPGDTALVVGLGSIGCLFVQLLRRAGLSVLSSDLDPARVALGRSFGALGFQGSGELAEAIGEVTGGRGVDVVVVTAGGAHLLSWITSLVRDGGSLHYFAGGEGESLPLSLGSLYHRELTLTATYSSSPAELGEAFDLLASGVIRVDRLITHRLPLDRLAEGVALTVRREAIKVFLVPPTVGSES